MSVKYFFTFHKNSHLFSCLAICVDQLGSLISNQSTIEIQIALLDQLHS